jgi:large subunit ribosomal protein L24
MTKKNQQPKFKSLIKKGDPIKILAGNLKGKLGTIRKINTKTMRVEIGLEDNDLIQDQNPSDETKEKSKSAKKGVEIHLSNVQIWDSLAKMSSRVGSKILNEKKVRYFKKSGNLI